jgi:hypothetical protein
MKDVLQVEHVELTRQGSRVTLQGDVGGEQLYWNMPDQPAVAMRGEPFIAALLVPAMTTGRDLRLPRDVPVDQAFLRSIDALQTIFERWFTGLRRVTIDASETASAPATSGRYAGYSGGVDSSYTVMRLGSALDGTVLVDGIEYSEPQERLMAEVEERLRAEMESRGLPLIRVATNTKLVGRRLGGHWPQFIGGSLASVPHAIGAAEYWVAGSNSWENLRPYGSHPITDPMWSSASVTIRHHGADARRIDKLRALLDAPQLLGALRVCFQGKGYNCGTCQKCLMTSAALRALGIQANAVPPLADPRLLRRLNIEHSGDLMDWIEILIPTLQRSDPLLARELNRLVHRFQWRQLMKQLDELVTGGRVRALLTSQR